MKFFSRSLHLHFTLLLLFQPLILAQSSTPANFRVVNSTESSLGISLNDQTSLPVKNVAGRAYELGLHFNPKAVAKDTGQMTLGTGGLTGSEGVASPNSNNTSGTAASAPILSSLSCAVTSMAGAGTNNCKIALSAAAPNGGVNVTLSSSDAAVKVPSAVTVPANATSAGFSAKVSSVVSAKAITLNANADSIFKSFAMLLIAAVPALNINASSIPFGNVVLNAPETQSVTLTSTGTAPVTISGATLTGAGFTMSGSKFPTTLNPNQEATLNVEFAPSVVGPATGQLTISSNASSNTKAIVSLSATGTAPVVVAVAPARLSAVAGTKQQLAATVTGTSNTSVSWSVSGSGCSGSGCGTISSNGVYTAPLSIPSPVFATITATSVDDGTKSASAEVTLLQASSRTYYLATAANGGNDSNSGLSANTPWRTPNHSVNCGDMILAAPGNYPSLMPFGTVTCPAGNNVAWLRCATFDTCKVVTTGGAQYTHGIAVNKSYWGVEGWEVTALSGGSGACFLARPAGAANIHHIIFANDVANGCSNGGFVADANAESRTGVDYFVVVGSIAYNASNTSVECVSGIDAGIGDIAVDSLPGTHVYFAGNFSYDNMNPTSCAGTLPTDGEGLFFDTPQYFGYSQQMVMDNNISVFNGGGGIQTIKNSTGSSNATIYLRHNTTYGNQRGRINTVTGCAEILAYLIDPALKYCYAAA